MYKDSTIRRVHAWALQQSEPFTVAQAMAGVELSHMAVWGILKELQAEGFAACQEQPRKPAGGKNQAPSRQPALWTACGTEDDVAEVFSEGAVIKPKPLKPYEAASSVWDYAHRCALEN